MLAYMIFVYCVTSGYCFLTNGQSSSSLTGTNPNVADIMRDLTSLRSLLLRANQNIYTLQSQLAVANQDIHSLTQEVSQYKMTTDELKQNQTHLLVELRNINNNAIHSTLPATSNKGVCGCQTEISGIRQQQTELRAVVTSLQNNVTQYKNKINAMSSTAKQQQHQQTTTVSSMANAQTTGKDKLYNYNVPNIFYRFLKCQIYCCLTPIIFGNPRSNVAQCSAIERGFPTMNSYMLLNFKKILSCFLYFFNIVMRC